MQGIPLPILGEGEEVVRGAGAPLNTWLDQVTWEGEDLFLEGLHPFKNNIPLSKRGRCSLCIRGIKGVRLVKNLIALLCPL
jgi:hypothetical protein